METEESEKRIDRVSAKTAGAMTGAAIIAMIVVAGYRQSLSGIEIAFAVLVMTMLPVVPALAWAAYKGARGERI